MTLPFRTAQTATAGDTHLVLNSPAVPGHSPDHLPPQALCGRAVTEPASTAVGDVHCRGCLLLTPAYLALPGFAGAA